MKFLILALCVCAASAASLGSFGSTYKPYQPQQVAKAAARPVAQAAAVVAAPFVAAAGATYNAAQAVAGAPVVAAKAVYTAGKQASVAGKESDATIVRSESDVAADGFNYFYETSSGIAAQASGVAKRVGNEDVLAIQGSYKYYTPEGEEVQLTYVADENGYQPQSNILPVGPAIPEAIVKSLEYIRTHYDPKNNL